MEEFPSSFDHRPDNQENEQNQPGGKRRTAPWRILLVDDHKVLRQGLAALLAEENDMLVVGEADHGQQALAMVEPCRPDVVVMDVSMPVMNGIDATRLLKQQWPEVRVIGLSMFDEFDLAQDMKQAGAEAYLSKVNASEALILAIRRGGKTEQP